MNNIAVAQSIESCKQEMNKLKGLIEMVGVMSPISNFLTKYIDFIPIEQWDFFDLPTRKYKNCDVQIQEANGIPLVKDFRIRIKKLYKKVCTQLSLGAENVGFEFEDVIRNQASGKYLKDY